MTGPQGQDRRVLELIADFRSAHGYSPAVRDLVRNEEGFRSTGTLQWRVRRLLRQGWVAMTPGIARSLRLTAAGAAALEERESSAADAD